MEIHEAIERILLGEPMRSVAESYRTALLIDLGMDPEDCEDGLMRKEAHRFLSKVSREMGENHEGDTRAVAALQDWVRDVEDYDAFDALLTHFQFDGRDVLIRRGQMLFPGPLTAHWTS